MLYLPNTQVPIDNTFNLAIKTAQVQPKEEPEILQYKVIEGDTLTKIAKKYNTTWLRLWQKNTNLNNQDALIVGETINIDSADEILAERPLYILPVREKTLEPIGDSPRQVSVQGKGSVGLNGYDYPSCTGYVALQRYVPPGLGNATSWMANAQARGMATGSTPRAGAIGWRPGHVVFTIRVDGDRIFISENNYDFMGSTRSRWASAKEFTYIY
ncbi:LysM peptidoglycan-binding domain-containing protein [Candidatus Saccharibacteria bacterium]|nr:LysM peptidoglycan-binding domain-containing protein [Candidatus Saccharibacteria bacterium]